MSKFLHQLLLFSTALLRKLSNSGSSLQYSHLIPAILLYAIKTQLNHEMYLKHSVNDYEYDYIIIGGGTAGSVMAARLSEDSAVSVLLLEAGISENVVTDVPQNAFNLQGTPIDWKYETLPQRKACFGMYNQVSKWPRGKVMGGTSTINTLVSIRGNSRDYDQWSYKGALGWSWPEVFPYFIKTENNIDPNYVSNGYHGVDGPFIVSTDPNPRIVTQAWERAGAEIGYPVGDHNGPIQSVFAIPQYNIKDGQRVSVAKAYLEPLSHRKNLHVLHKSFVTKILFNDKKRAVGVQFDRLFKSYTVRARREVILSAGVINSPQILMLSGIGPKEHLKQLGIPVISDLSVGDNLQEHVASGIPFSVNATIGIDFLTETSIPYIVEYLATRKNYLAKNIDEATAFVKTKYTSKFDDWPDVQLNIFPGSLATDYGLSLRRMLGLKKSIWNQVFKPYVGSDTFTIYSVGNRPLSRGWVRIKSKDPYDPPLIQPNLFDREEDLNVVVEGMKIALKLGRTKAFQQFNAQPFKYAFPGCEHLPLYSDKYLRCMARIYTNVAWHPCCSVKMGPKSDPTAVVDTQLRVKGVTGLRVVDGSIMPTIISGNVNTPTLMIAEKIADEMRGRRLKPFAPPMTPSMIKKLPHLPYETWDQNLVH